MIRFRTGLTERRLAPTTYKRIDSLQADVFSISRVFRGVTQGCDLFEPPRFNAAYRLNPLSLFTL